MGTDYKHGVCTLQPFVETRGFLMLAPGFPATVPAMNTMFIGPAQRLRTAINSLVPKTSLRKVALAAGLSPQTLSNAIRRDSISVDVAKALEPVTGYHWQWLFDGTGPMKHREGNVVLADLAQGMRRIPVISLDAAVNWPTNSKDEGVMGEILVDGPTTEGLGSSAFAITVDDDSMKSGTPESVQRGDIVIIDPDVKPQPGDLVVAQVHGMTRGLFRKYRELGLDAEGRASVELVPLNPDFAPLKFDADRPGSIVGVMVEHRRLRRVARGV
jgi:SOS-response transcriptional repressor LexA